MDIKQSVSSIVTDLIGDAKQAELEKLRNQARAAWTALAVIVTLSIAFTMLGIWVDGRWGATAGAMIVPLIADGLLLVWIYEGADRDERAATKIERRIRWQIENPGRPMSYYREID